MSSEAVPLIETVGRMWRIVRSLAALGTATQREVAADTGLARSTVRRYLATLEDEGIVVQRLTHKYTLSLRVLQHGSAKRQRWELYHAARPVVDRLAADTGGLVTVTTVEPDGIVRLDTFPGRTDLTPQECEWAFPSGTRVSPHATATGKATLSALAPERIEELTPSSPTTYTEETIADRQALAGAIGRVDDRGLAIERRERHTDRSAVAAPITDPRRSFGHAIGVAHTADTVARRRDRIEDRVADAASELQARFDEMFDPPADRVV